jgi:ethanolamine ammonia-lyase small subunit
VVEDALATDAPHQVLYDLGQDPDKAARILKMPRAKRIAEFTRMTMKTPAKPAVSRAPAPTRPVTGQPNKAFDFADEKVDDATWYEKFDEVMAKRMSR